MDERLLAYYNSELRHVREMAGEFAREFPKIAGRLALDRDAKDICPDPYVERLLEGFAFLAARVHLKLDAEFPRFTQSMLETRWVDRFPLNDQEVLCRHLHKVVGDWVDEHEGARP